MESTTYYEWDHFLLRRNVKNVGFTALQKIQSGPSRIRRFQTKSIVSMNRKISIAICKIDRIKKREKLRSPYAGYHLWA